MMMTMMIGYGNTASDQVRSVLGFGFWVLGFEFFEGGGEFWIVLNRLIGVEIWSQGVQEGGRQV